MTPHDDVARAPAGMPLKVLYILPPTRTFAGIERVIDEIADEIARQAGHRIDVDVLFTTDYGDGPAGPRRYRRILRVVEGRRALIRTFRAVVGAKPYDLVVVPQVEATVLAWLSCLGLGRRFVLYLHGNPNLEVRSWKARVLFSVMDRLVLSRLAGVFGVSRTQLRSFREVYPSRVPHFWVPNPVRRFEPAPTAGRAGPGDRESGTVTFVKVGRFSYQKGQDILLRAFAKTVAQRPAARLVLVGYGPEEEDLRALIASLGLADVARIAHHPHDPQVPLEAADVYVSASRWEGWSLAICEALRVGLPVIATDCEFGPSDILTDRRLGRLVAPENEDALAAAMVSVHDDLDAERAHAAFRVAYVEQFDAEVVARDHVAALEQSFQACRPGRPRRPLPSAQVT